MVRTRICSGCRNFNDLSSLTPKYSRGKRLLFCPRCVKNFNKGKVRLQHARANKDKEKRG